MKSTDGGGGGLCNGRCREKRRSRRTADDNSGAYHLPSSAVVNNDWAVWGALIEHFRCPSGLGHASVKPLSNGNFAMCACSGGRRMRADLAACVFVYSD